MIFTFVAVLVVVSIVHKVIITVIAIMPVWVHTIVAIPESSESLLM